MDKSDSVDSAAEYVINVHRKSTKGTVVGGLIRNGRSSDLNFELMAQRDASIAEALSIWMSKVTDITVRGSSPAFFLEDLSSGVVLCLLVQSLGCSSLPKFHMSPSNEFQRMENFDFFSQSLQGLGLTCRIPTASRKEELGAYLPCLLFLAFQSGKVRKTQDVKPSAAAAEPLEFEYRCVFCQEFTDFASEDKFQNHLEIYHPCFTLSSIRSWVS